MSDDSEQEALKRTGRKGKRTTLIDDSESSSESSFEHHKKRKRVLKVKSDSEDAADSDSPLLNARKKRPHRVMSESEESEELESEESGSSSDEDEDEGEGSASSSEGEGVDEEEEEVESDTSSFSEWESEEEEEEVVAGAGATPQVQSTSRTEPQTNDPETASTSSRPSAAATAAAYSSDSSDGQSEKCPICLLSFTTQEVGTPESCDHSFCADCLQEWSKNVNTCPVDRQVFTLILVRRCLEGKVIRRIPIEAPRRQDEEEVQEDPTYCEVCGECDREDRMLLCDGCDLGYHLECLDPPLDTVPLEEWFCPDCILSNSVQLAEEVDIQDGELTALIEDASAIGLPPLRPRVSRLLPRTRQSERVRATMRTRQRQREEGQQGEVQAQPSTSSGFDSLEADSNASAPRTVRRRNTAGGTRKGRKTIKRKSVKRRKKRRKTTGTKKAKVTKASSKDKFEGSKKKLKRKRKIKRKKRKTISRRARRPARVIVPLSVKGRLAEHLGVCPSRRPGQTIPDVRPKVPSSRIDFQRSRAGIPTLHLFGQRNQLDYFSGSDHEEAGETGGSVSVVARPRTAVGNLRNLINRKQASLSARSLRSISVPSSDSGVGTCDLIGSILDSQSVWHSRKTVATINRDGSLQIQSDRRSSDSRKSESGVNVRTDDRLSQISSTSAPVNVSEAGSSATSHVTQAPMYPGRSGGSGARPPPAGGSFHQFGGGRYSSSPSYGYQGGRGYSNFTSPPSFDSRGARAGYANYLNSGPLPPPPPPLPPFRGNLLRFRMTPPRYPIRRPQAPPQPPQQGPATSSMDFPPVDDIDDNMEDQKQSTKPAEDEEEIDIYSDIEVGGGSNSGGAGGAEPDDNDRGMELSYEALPPPPVPPALLMGMSDEEPESDNELVIDDNVTPSTPENQNEELAKPDIPESEKYDPAEPSNDTDEEEEALAKANVTAPVPITSGSCPVMSQSSNSNASYLHSPTYGESSGLITDLKIPSLSGEIAIPKLGTAVRDEDARHSSNEEDEEECPNFSIYSAASMDIARRTTTKEEEDEPQPEPEPEMKTEDEANVESSKEEEECSSPIEEKDENSNASAADAAAKEENPAEQSEVEKEKEEEEQEEEEKEEEDIPTEKADIKTDDEGEKSEDDKEDKDEPPEPPQDDTSTAVVEIEAETENKAVEEVEEEEEEAIIAEEAQHAKEDTEEKSEEVAEEAEEGIKKISLVEEIFGSDDDSLIGGATSAVSAATVDNAPQTAVTPIGLEGLDTETISETEEAINFEDDLSHDDGFLTAEEDGEIPSGKKKKKKKSRKSSLSGSAGEEGTIGKDQEPIDYEEGEIVDDRPKPADGLKKDKKLDKKDKSKYDKDVQKSGDENFDVTGKSKSSTDEERKKKKKKSSEKRASSKERIVLSSSENKEKNKDRSSKGDDSNIAWKKPSKSTKERNYRDTKTKGDTDPSKAKEAAKKKEDLAGKKEKKKKEKRKDMERYDVRKVVGDKKRKRRDAFGRDLSRERSISKSRSRSRGRSYDRVHGRSRSLSRSRITRSRGRSPVKSRLRSRSRSRLRSRSRSRLRSRSRSKTRTKVKSKDRSRKSRSKDRLRSRISRSRSRGRRSRSRSHSRSRNRSRLRSRSRSLRRSKDRKDKSREGRSQRCRYRERRSWSHSWTPSWSRSRSVSYSSYSRSRSPTPRRYNRSYSRSFSRSWSRERHERIPVIEKKSISKTAKKLTVIVSNTKDDSERQRKKEKKRKEAKKSKEALLSLEKRKKRKEKSPAPSKEVFTSGDNILVSVNFNKSNKSTSSKDISASGITLVSKESSKRKQHDESFEIEREPAKKMRKEKGSKEKSSPRQKNGNVTIEKVMVRSAEKKSKKVAQKVNAKASRLAQLMNKKPVAIIDLDQSPFHEQTPSPRDLIVLSDSEDEGMNKEAEREELVESLNSLRSLRSRTPSPKVSSKQGPPPSSLLARTPEPESPAPVVNYLVTSTGPKTPPEPQIKFSIASKTQLRSITNPLREDEEDMMAEDGGLDDLDQRIEEELDRELDRDRVMEVMHKGPNTPPEPRGPTTPCSPPTSPDAYDPFDPTKSGTPSPVGAGISMDGPPSPVHTPSEQLMQLNVMNRESPAVSELEELAGKSLEARAATPAVVTAEEVVEHSSQSPERTKLSVRVDAVMANSPSIMPETASLPPPAASDNETSQPLELADTTDKSKQMSLGLQPSVTSASITDTNAAKSPERSISVVINTQTQNLQGTPAKPPTFPNNSLKVAVSQQPITSTPTHSAAPAPAFPALTPANIASILCTPPPSALPLSRMALFNPSAIPVSQIMAQQQQPMLSSPVIMQQRPPPTIARTTPEKLPAPPTPSKLPARANTVQNGEQTQSNQKQPPDTSTDVIDMDLESPYSPGSSEGDDLFEPPSEVKSVTPSSSYAGVNERNRSMPLPNKNTNKLPPPLAAILHKSPNKGAPNQDKFDTLFGMSPLRPNKAASKTLPAKHTLKSHHSKSNKTKAGKHDKSKGGKKEIAIKMDEDQLQILDDLPSSAVELQVKDKFLKKLNRQERVVEEVKLSLKPHYTKKHITKEEYKEILRRSVPKICHNKSGEINPIKISSLVEAYVKKYRYAKKKNAVAAKQPKATKTTMWS